MRTRFCATMRRPTCSIMALIAPVRLRAVASGLMIEKVRSIAITTSFAERADAVRGLIAAARGSGKIGIPEARSELLHPGPHLDLPAPCAFRLAQQVHVACRDG